MSVLFYPFLVSNIIQLCLLSCKFLYESSSKQPKHTNTNEWTDEQMQTNTNVNTVTIENGNTTSGSFPWGCRQAVLELGPSEVSPCSPTSVCGARVTFSHVRSYLMPSDVKCQPHPKQLHLLVFLKGYLPSQLTEKHCVTLESVATFSNEFYSANLLANSPTLAAPSTNCYASLQWLLAQNEKKMASRQTPSRRTYRKIEFLFKHDYNMLLFLPWKVRGCFL